MKKTYQRRITLLLALVLIIQSLIQPAYAIAAGFNNDTNNQRAEASADPSISDGQNSIFQTSPQETSDQKQSKTEIITEDGQSLFSEEKAEQAPPETTNQPQTNPEITKPAEESQTLPADPENQIQPENDQIKEEEKLEENLIEEENLEEPVEEILPTEDLTEDQRIFGENLQPGDAQIFTLPKTHYLPGEDLDLTGIQIIGKDLEGQIFLLDLEDLEENPQIILSPNQGMKVAGSYYKKLEDPAYLLDEAQSFKEKVENYLRENPIIEENPQVKIEIPGFKPLNIDLEVEEGDLDIEPIDLFKALRMPNSSIIILNTDKLTYTDTEEISFENLRVLLKDQTGNLSVLQGLDPRMTVDTTILDQIKDQIARDKNFSEGFRDQAWYLENFSTTDLLRTINPQKVEEEPKAHKPVETFVTIKVSGYADAYLPITLVSPQTEITGLEDKANAFIRTEGRKIDTNKYEYKIILDVTKVADIKDISLDFLEKDTKADTAIKLTKIVKTDGYNEEDITLTDPSFRNTEDLLDPGFLENYQAMDPMDLQRTLENLEISNPVDLATKLDTGYKYIFTVEMEKSPEEKALEAPEETVEDLSLDLGPAIMSTPVGAGENFSVEEEKVEADAPTLLVDVKTRISEEAAQSGLLEDNIVEKEILVSALDSTQDLEVDTDNTLVEPDFEINDLEVLQVKAAMVLLQT